LTILKADDLAALLLDFPHIDGVVHSACAVQKKALGASL
jgi:hypothetical protein